MKLYTVRVQHTYIVAAPDLNEAWKEGKNVLEEVLRNEKHLVEIVNVERLQNVKMLPDGYEPHSLPYRSVEGDEIPISHYLESQD